MKSRKMGPSITYPRLKTFLEQYQSTSSEHFTEGGATQDTNLFSRKKGVYILYLFVLKGKGRD